MSAAKTMAEVLAEHPSLFGAYEWTCSGCNAPIGGLTDGGGPQLLAAHQAAALSSAGFGLVADAKAEALEEAVDDFSVNLTVMSGPRIRSWLSSKAAKYRAAS